VLILHKPCWVFPHRRVDVRILFKEPRKSLCLFKYCKSLASARFLPPLQEPARCRRYQNPHLRIGHDKSNRSKLEDKRRRASPNRSTCAAASPFLLFPEKLLYDVPPAVHGISANRVPRNAEHSFDKKQKADPAIGVPRYNAISVPNRLGWDKISGLLKRLQG